MKTATKRFKILIVDDAPINRMLLSDMLEENYDIVEAENGLQAVSILERSAQDFALVLLDIVMPELDGFGVLAYMNKNHWISDLPVIIISSETVPAIVRRAYQLGVSDFLARPFDTEIVRQRVNNTILLYAKQRRLENIVADQIYEKEKTKNLMVSILSHIVEFRNGESGLHVLHITTITEMLLKALAKKTDRYHLTPELISLTSSASALHDIGKISIPNEIINKPGRLTKEEFEVIKTHAAVGAEMLGDLPIHTDEPLVKAAYSICRWHHERYDGKGYPDGLAGDDIPISAQVVALADVYDALTSERCYKSAYTHSEAIAMILDGQCGSFNPLLLECLTELGDALPNALGIISLSRHHIDQEAVRAELTQREPHSISAIGFKQIQIEREKYRFMMDVLPEGVFSYNRGPDVFTLSPRAAKALELSEVISAPQENGPFRGAFGDGFLERAMGLADGTTREAPDFTMSGTLTAGGTARPVTFRCRSIWIDDEPDCCGLMGQILEG